MSEGNKIHVALLNNCENTKKISVSDNIILNC